jgi:beta-phosphoglucomutase
MAPSEPVGAAGPRRPPERIKALIYDFDDTIVQSELINDELFLDFMHRGYGIELSREEQEYLYGFAWSGVFAWLREHRGLAVTRDEAWVTFLEIKRRYLRGRKLRVASGFDRMLTLPVAHAIVSGSTRAEIDMMLENIGMRRDMVRFILCDEDCANGKPDPEGFLMALERLGTRPEETLVFEDSAAGIKAATEAGIPVAFVAELASRGNAERADMSFGSFNDAWDWVRTRVGIE